jgi:phage terminase large subunit GpA-like protein
MPSPASMLSEALLAARTRPPRSMLQFAEEEIVLPTGPYAGFRFSARTQPFAALFFRALSEGSWRRWVVTGPVQSGKTLTAFVVPVLWYLFEASARVIIAAPTITTTQDKWEQDLLPVIRASHRLATRLPTRGAGSAGGETHVLDFGRGALLRFMGGTGGDKARASFTARVVVITETDGMDQVKEASREADPITQLEARTQAYGASARIGMECTVSHDTGRTWSEYLASTHSRIACPCPHCGAWVTPEREHLVGWREAANVVDAGELAHWACPACACAIDEDQRRRMNQAAVLVHQGQEVECGQVVGTPVRTDTLGFRWTAWNNLFQSTSAIAAGEWSALRAKDRVAAERSRMQFHWVIPVKAEGEVPQHQLDIDGRVDAALPRGVVPAWAVAVIVGADVGKFAIHWSAKAFRVDGTCHTVEYGVEDVRTAELGEKRAIMQALRALHARASTGWKLADGTAVPARLMLVDSNYDSDVVHAFARDHRADTFPTMGRGHGQEHRSYWAPKRRAYRGQRIGDHWHIERLQRDGGRRRLLEFSTNYWKSQLRARIETPRGEPGAWTLHAQLQESEHHSFARHLSAEVAERVYDPRKGETVELWKARRSQNHWLDAEVLALLGGSVLGLTPSLAPEPAQEAEPAPPLEPEQRQPPPPATRASGVPRRTVKGVRMSGPMLQA